ncbi:hypothetical protein [uncultured Sphingomonas sp.]|uniref:hypothetical protein n=1 Tax=uncultured Sphingomonas sp. TaxID=158754 RepID=UPI0025E610ED|nr:hypothetical protein [uncultured Sphingomonas sp.]
MRDVIDRWTPRLGDEAPYWALALTCLAGLAFKLHCGAYWLGAEQYTTGCYSDAVPFWGLRGVAAGQVPYFQARMEYPVLTGALIWVEGLVARVLGLGRPDAADFLTAVWLGNTAFAYLILHLMRRAGIGRLRQYAWALAPPLVLYVAHNWDLLAGSLAVAAVLAASRGQDVRATALAALGGAAKLFPLLLLPLLGLGALCRRGSTLGSNVARAALLVLAALAAWGAVNLPVAATAFTNWSEFYAFSNQRSGTAASVWELANTFNWYPTDIPARNRLALIAFFVGAAAIVLAGWRRHAAHLWVLFTPVLAWFLLTNKVWSPQFDLWMWPLLVLTGTRARPLALFLLGDLLAYFTEFWLFAGLEGAWPSATQVDVATAAAIRGVAVLWIIWAAVRDPAPAWINRITPPRAAAPHSQGRPIPTG